MQARLQKFVDRQVAATLEPLVKLEEGEGLEGIARGLAFRCLALPRLALPFLAAPRIASLDLALLGICLVVIYVCVLIALRVVWGIVLHWIFCKFTSCCFEGFGCFDRC